MSDFEYQIPETYDEAVKRKADVLQMINDYNVALLLGNDLPYSEEEIERLQEEYQILNDHLALTEDERLAKLDDDDKIVNEDGTVEEKQSIFDKIHWSIYLVAVVSFIACCGIFTKAVGNACMESFLNNYFSDLLWNKEVDMLALEKSEYMWSAFDYWFRACVSYLWLPLLGILISVVYYFFFRKRKDINSKISGWLIVVNVVLFLVSIAIIFLPNDFQEFRNLQLNYENLALNYAYYYYGELGSSGY